MCSGWPDAAVPAVLPRNRRKCRRQKFSHVLWSHGFLLVFGVVTSRITGSHLFTQDLLYYRLLPIYEHGRIYRIILLQRTTNSL